MFAVKASSYLIILSPTGHLSAQRLRTTPSPLPSRLRNTSSLIDRVGSRLVVAESFERTMPRSKSSKLMESADPTCVVCGDRANGLHYRVLTCEGCKTFFRRNVRRRETLKCGLDSGRGGHSTAAAAPGCEMDLYTRRHCPACRMKKCLEVGMQINRVWDDARLAGRKPLVRKSSKSSGQSPAPTPTATSPQDWAPQEMPPPLVGGESKVGHARHAPQLTQKQLQLMDSLEKGIQLALHVGHPVERPLSLQEKKLLESPDADTYSQLSFGDLVSLESITGQLKAAQGSSSHHSPPDTITASLPPKGMLGNDPTTPAPKGMLGNDPAPTPKSMLGNDAAPPAPDVTAGGSQLPRGRAVGGAGSAEVEGDRRVIHGEMCDHMLTMLVVVVKQVIQFAKCVPGFSGLTTEDQALLIKTSFLECLFLGAAMAFDPSREAFVNSQTSSEYNNDIVAGSGFDIQEVQDFARSMMPYQLTRREYALLQAIIILSPDREGLRDSGLVEGLQEPVVMTLQDNLRLNFGHDKCLFAKLLSKVTDLRCCTAKYIDNFLNIKLQGKQLTPVLQEIFPDV